MRPTRSPPACARSWPTEHADKRRSQCWGRRSRGAFTVPGTTVLLAPTVRKLPGSGHSSGHGALTLLDGDAGAVPTAPDHPRKLPLVADRRQHLARNGALVTIRRAWWTRSRIAIGTCGAGPAVLKDDAVTTAVVNQAAGTVAPIHHACPSVATGGAHAQSLGAGFGRRTGGLASCGGGPAGPRPSTRAAHAAHAARAAHTARARPGAAGPRHAVAQVGKQRKRAIIRIAAPGERERSRPQIVWDVVLSHCSHQHAAHRIVAALLAPGAGADQQRQETVARTEMPMPRATGRWPLLGRGVVIRAGETVLRDERQRILARTGRSGTTLATCQHDPAERRHTARATGDQHTAGATGDQHPARASRAVLSKTGGAAAPMSQSQDHRASVNQRATDQGHQRHSWLRSRCPRHLNRLLLQQNTLSAALHAQTSGDVGFVEPVQRIQKMREESAGALGACGGDLTGQSHDRHGVRSRLQRQGIHGGKAPVMAVAVQPMPVTRAIIA